MSISIYHNIVKWSKSRTKWQQDALRRILQHGSLMQNDLEELVLMCQLYNNIELPKNKQVPNPISLELKNMTIDSINQKNIKLLSISNVKNVNRLVEEQKLTFGDSGLTVIYGDNGTGKSGYCRILKQVCRARGRNKKILSDVFNSKNDVQSSAKIEYAMGKNNLSFDWTKKYNTPSVLANISFFDVDCAAVYITEENELAYSPGGLDVLVKLVECCRKMRTIFEEKLRKLEDNKPSFLSEKEDYVNTEASRILKSLSYNSDLREIKKLCELSKKENVNIKSLQESLLKDPEKQKKYLKLLCDKIKDLRDISDKIFQTASDENVKKIKKLWREMNETKEAEKMVAKELFTKKMLPNVGSNIWKQLWEAARCYSEQEAYKGKIFPVTKPESKCVLCQQELSKEASVRLIRFERFVKGKIKKQSELAEKNYCEAIDKIKSSYNDTKNYKDYLKELELEDACIAKEIRKNIGFARWRCRSIINYFKSELSGKIFSTQSSIRKEIEETLKNILQKINACDKASKPETRELLKKELIELEAKKWLSSKINDVNDEICRLQKINKYKNCISSVDTTGITKKNNDLTNEFVTEALKDKFIDELKNLGLTYLGIELVNIGGQYGSTRYQLKQTSAKWEANLSQVLSEGEFHCIALAAFFSELATSPTESTLIFDDPVSSLDHKWRRKVAKRLVEEAARRQVIIFTHDIVFLYKLCECANSKNISNSLSYLISNEQRKAGICLDGVPWVAMSVNNRIGYLNDQCQKANSINNASGYNAYEPIACVVYGLLRETWERAVEEVLFNEVILRYGGEIQTNRLRYVHDIQQNDIKTIEDNMRKCSCYLSGHDQAYSDNEPVPNPSELLQDIRVLKNWVKSIRKRREKSKKK